MKNKHKTDALSREFHKFIADIESLLNETANLTGEELVHARDKLNDRVSDARDSVSSMSKDLARSASKSAAKANLQVHEEAWIAIGGAAAAGLILGMLFARK